MLENLPYVICAGETYRTADGTKATITFVAGNRIRGTVAGMPTIWNGKGEHLDNPGLNLTTERVDVPNSQSAQLLLNGVLVVQLGYRALAEILRQNGIVAVSFLPDARGPAADAARDALGIPRYQEDDTLDPHEQAKNQFEHNFYISRQFEETNPTLILQMTADAIEILEANRQREVVEAPGPATEATYIQTSDCTTCAGLGFVADDTGQSTDCPRCSPDPLEEIQPECWLCGGRGHVDTGADRVVPCPECNARLDPRPPE